MAVSGGTDGVFTIALQCVSTALSRDKVIAVRDSDDGWLFRSRLGCCANYLLVGSVLDVIASDFAD